MLRSMLDQIYLWWKRSKDLIFYPNEKMWLFDMFSLWLCWAYLDASKIVHISSFGHLYVRQKRKVKISECEKNLLPFIRSIHHTCSTSFDPTEKGEKNVRMMMVRPNGNYFECSSSAINYGDCVSMNFVWISAPKTRPRTSQSNYSFNWP